MSRSYFIPELMLLPNMLDYSSCHLVCLTQCLGTAAQFVHCGFKQKIKPRMQWLEHPHLLGRRSAGQEPHDEGHGGGVPT